MTPTKLLSPAAIALHLLLVAGVLIYARLFGPPQPQSIPVPYQELKTGLKVEGAPQTSPHAHIDQSLLLSETRPGAMRHQSFFERDGASWGKLENRWTAQLTIDPKVKKVADYHFSKSRAALGALAIVEVDSGRIIGWSEHIDPSHPVTKKLKPNRDIHLALQAIAPSSGVFRLVTASALLEGGVSPLRSYCYTKFKGTWLQEYHLTNRNPNGCNHLTEAIATTDNSYLAFVSHSELSSDQLKKASQQLGFDQRYSYFGLPYELSVAQIPQDSLTRAKTALGFQGSKMNVLHAALLMGAIASDGKVRSPRLVERIIDEEGREISAPQFPPMAQGVSPSTAARLRRMMKSAIQEAPAGGVFQKWPSKLRDMRVAGQASVRTYRKPDFIRYTWFVGYVPAESPQWAVAVMVVNHQQWYVRALDIAHRVLREVLSQLQEQK